MKRMFVLVPLLLLLVSLASGAAAAQKIAVSSEGATPSSLVSSIAARSHYFMIFDNDGKLLEAIKNPYRTAKGSASSQVNSLLSGKGVTVIVAGAFGQKMVMGMQSKGIKYLEFKGTVADAVKQAQQ